MKTAQEVADLIRPLLPTWSLCGHGPEIIQFQSPAADGYKVLTLRSVYWPNGYGQLAQICDWYIFEELHGPNEEIQKLVNTALETFK
jgi:hypothetical protein